MAKCRECFGVLSGGDFIRWGKKRYHEEHAPETWVRLVKNKEQVKEE